MLQSFYFLLFTQAYSVRQDEITWGKKRLKSTSSHSKAVVLSQDDFALLLSVPSAPRLHVAMREPIWIITTRGRGVQLASSWRRPGVHVLRCTGQPPTKNYSAQNVNSAKVENSRSKAHTLIVDCEAAPCYCHFSLPIFEPCLYTWVCRNWRLICYGSIGISHFKKEFS